jgi:hypothetical protein
MGLLTKRVVALVAFVVVSMPVSAVTQGTWFPAFAQENVAKDLAQRLARIDIGIEEARLLPSARAAVSEMKLRIETLGEKKLMELAPRLPKLNVPMAGQPQLDAMARLGMCTFYLEARLANLSGVDVDGRLDAALGPMALALSTMYFRHFYMAGGGTDEQIKAYLAGDPQNKVAFEVQKNADLLNYTATECRTVVSALLD